MKTLITGMTGMIGGHMARACVNRGWQTYGLARSSAASRLAGAGMPNLYHCDIMERDALERIMDELQPGLVVHLAAQAFNGSSWAAEETTHRTNYLGSLNVLKACRRKAPGAKILLACSSAEYGDVKPEDTPLKEDRPLRPITPYGVSKAATEALGYQYWANYGLEVYLPRLFIQVGTGHPPATAIQNFARQLALIAHGKMEPVIKVGDLSTARDFVDVRDGVEAMLLLLEKGRAADPVNICRAKAHRISDVLDTLIEISGLSVEIARDPALMRPSDEPLLLGDNRKLKSLGWSPRYSLRDTLQDVYRDWMQRVAHEA